MLCPNGPVITDSKGSIIQLFAGMEQPASIYFDDLVALSSGYDYDCGTCCVLLQKLHWWHRVLFGIEAMCLAPSLCAHH